MRRKTRLAKKSDRGVEVIPRAAPQDRGRSIKLPTKPTEPREQKRFDLRSTAHTGRWLASSKRLVGIPSSFPIRPRGFPDLQDATIVSLHRNADSNLRHRHKPPNSSLGARKVHTPVKSRRHQPASDTAAAAGFTPPRAAPASRPRATAEYGSHRSPAPERYCVPLVSRSPSRSIPAVSKLLLGRHYLRTRLPPHLHSETESGKAGHGPVNAKNAR